MKISKNYSCSSRQDQTTLQITSFLGVLVDD